MKTQAISIVVAAAWLLVSGTLHAVQLSDVGSAGAPGETSTAGDKSNGPGPAASARRLTDNSAATAPQVPPERQERGGSITIGWSEKNDELSGFSDKTGRWQKLRITPEEKIQPACEEAVGAVRLKDGIAAFSGQTGTWDVVHLPETSTAMPTVSPDVVQFREGDHSYAFSAATGCWTSPTDPAMKALTVQVLSPKHLSAAELRAKLMDWTATVPAAEVDGTIQWLDGVLSLLPRKKAWQEAAEAEIAKLDVPGANTIEPGVTGPGPSKLSRGFGGGGFGGGFGGRSDFGNAREVSTSGLIITWSENKDEIRGFSNSKGEWDILKIEKQDQIVPSVNNDVAAVRLGNTMAAFSASHAQWDVIPLSEGSTAFPAVFNGYVKTEDNGHLYTFADAKGRWTSPTDPELQPATEQIMLAENGGSNGRVAFEAWLKSLPLYKSRGISMNVSPGPLGAIVRSSRQSWMKETREKIAEFWGPAESPVNEPPRASSGRAPEEVDFQIARLREEFGILEQAAQTASGPSSPLATDKEKQHRELRKLAEQSFDLRQQLHRLEAERMRLKLQLIEANLNAREKSRESIVARRVEDLQTGNTEPAPSIKEETRGIAKPVNAGTPIGLVGPPHLPIDGSAAVPYYSVRGPIADSTTQRSGVDRKTPMQHPTEIFKSLNGFRQNLKEHHERQEYLQRNVEKWSRPLETLVAEKELAKGDEAKRLFNLGSAQDELSQAKQMAADELSDWRYTWTYYQSILRLLKLDVEAAAVQLEKQQGDYEQKIAANKRDPGLFNEGELARQSANVAAEKINVQRMQELLKIYTDIAASEPGLNPDSVSAEWNPATKENTAASDSVTGADEPKQSQSMTDVQPPPTQRSPGSVALVGSWNEVQQIVETLRKCRNDFQKERSKIAQSRLRLAKYRTPFSDWKSEESAAFRDSVETFRNSLTAGAPRTANRNPWGSSLNVDIRAATNYLSIEQYLQRKHADGELTEITDVVAMMDQIRLDLIPMLEAQTKEDEARLKEPTRRWNETWNAYVNRRQLLMLDVQEQTTRLQEATQLVRSRGENPMTNVNAKSAVRLAEIQLQRSEATLKPYVDIEVQHPELNPDSMAEEKPMPDAAEKL